MNARAGSLDLGSLRRRLMVSVAALSTLVALALVLIVQVVLAGTNGHSVQRLLNDRADAVVASIDTASRGTALRVPSSRLDPGVVVYDHTGRPVGGSVPPSQTSTFADLAADKGRAVRRQTGTSAFLARPFRTAGGVRGVVVLSESLAPYELDEQNALWVSLLAGVVIVVAATALAAQATRRSLQPVAQMARTAEDWSHHDLDKRFDLGPPTDEIRALGHTLDGLLDRVAGAITAEQRLTSELAHELRSPLTAISGTADLIARRTDLDEQLREDVEDIRESCRAMAHTISGLLDLARAQSSVHTGSQSELGPVLDIVLRDLPLAERVGVRLDRRLRVGVPTQLAVRALAPVVHNAVRYAEHVVVSADTVDGHVHVTVADDGPGVPADSAERIFEAGHTGGGGSGLGLALVRRITRSVGGDITLTSPDPARSGATFVVSLPRTDLTRG